MRDVNAALYEFWSSFGIPAYREGRVPTDAEYPYITFNVVSGDALTSTTLIAQDWHKAPGATAAAADMLDEIAKAIPKTGTILPIGGRGFLAIYRNPGEWQSYVQDPEDSDVIGGKTKYVIRFYLI